MKFYTFILILLSTISPNYPLIGQNLPEFEDKSKDTIIHIMNLNNPVQITMHQADPNYVTMKSNTGFVTKLNDTSYTMRYTTPLEDEVKLKLYYKNLPVDIITVKLKALSTPVISLNGIAGGKISKDDIIAAKMMTLDFEESLPKGMIFELVSCNLSIMQNGVIIQNLNLRSLKIPENIITILKNLNPGDSIKFDDIRVKLGNAMLNLDPRPTIFELY